MSNIGLLIQDHRRRALLTQKELAKRSGVSTRTIRRLESGQFRNPRPATIRAIADHLGLGATAHAEFLAVAAHQHAWRYAEFDPRADTEPSSSTVPPEHRHSQLPADVADFVGRDVVIARLREALSGQANCQADARAPRVVGIFGPAGVGKSALAVRVGHLLSEHFPYGQLYLDLHGMTEHPLSAEDALGRLVRCYLTCDTTLPPDIESRSALYRSIMRHNRALIILDDASDEAQVRPLLPGDSESAVLLTSRRPLAALDNLTAFDLGVLERGEATELLRRIIGDQSVKTDPGALEDIAGLCGNLPLALRIAGTRIARRPHWTVRRMADQLADEDGRLDALTISDLAVRTAIELSYRGLPPHLGRLFRLLGTLGTTEIPVAAAASLLCVPTSAAEQQLEELVDARLVEPRRPHHYGMHTLVRLYARERALAEDYAQWNTVRAAARNLLDAGRGLDDDLTVGGEAAQRLTRAANLL